MTRITGIAVGAFGFLALAGMAALPNPLTRMGFAPTPQATDQLLWSEDQMAARDHEKVRSAIVTMCDATPSAATNTGGTSQSATAHPRTTFQTAALDYSDELKDQRIKIAKQIDHDRLVTWLYQLGIICFGAFATILIGLRPLFEKLNRDKLNTAIAAAAIVFSGMVTSLSSLNAIEASQTDLLHNQRTLAQLQQLHWRIDNDVFAATQLCDLNSSDLAKVESWKDRFEKITDEAMPTVAQPGDLRQIPRTMATEKPAPTAGDRA